MNDRAKWWWFCVIAGRAYVFAAVSLSEAVEHVFATHNRMLETRDVKGPYCSERRAKEEARCI
jgi:hypothetical protein